MSTLNDNNLTHDGVSIGTGSGRLLLIACGALAKEILTIIQANKWTHIDLQCLPAILHNHPDEITPAVREMIVKKRPDYGTIFVVYADCGTGGHLFDLCKEMGVEMISGPHCYSFYEGNNVFAKHDDEITAFYLTDFLVRQFDAFVWKPLGLDRHPELRDMYFGNYEKLVYQAQTDDADLDKKAEECATRLGLKFERRFTGYGDLQVALENLS